MTLFVSCSWNCGGYAQICFSDSYELNNLLKFQPGTGKIIQNDKLGDHCDQVYDAKGNFKVSMNSQEPWTPVVIASFGATRTVTFQLWNVNTKKPVGKPIPIEMKDGDVFVLHPADEYPSKYTFHKVKAGKWKHGVSGLESDDHLSAAVMFCAVNETVEVDSSNKQISSEHVEELMETEIESCQKTGVKKRSEYYDSHKTHLDDFLKNQEDKVHEEIKKAAIRVGII